MEEKICKKQKNVEKRIKMIYNRFGTKKEKICEIKINRLLNNTAIYTMPFHLASLILQS